MTPGGKGRFHGGAVVQRETTGERPLGHDVREGVCHRNDIGEQVDDGEPEGWRTPVRVPLGSIDEFVGDFDRRTLATTSEARWVPSPVARPASDARWGGSGSATSSGVSTQVISRIDEDSVARQQPAIDAVYRGHMGQLTHERITARNRLVSGG